MSATTIDALSSSAQKLGLPVVFAAAVWWELHQLRAELVAELRAERAEQAGRLDALAGEISTVRACACGPR